MTDGAKDFGAEIGAAYATDGAAVDLGQGILEGKLYPEAKVRIPLSMMNRHGLIAGATGTGKTVSLRVLAEQLSDAGVPVFLADIKGDLASMVSPGEASGSIGERATELGLDFKPSGYPVEFLSLGGIGPGVPVRATVSDFGPTLLAKVLEANETQADSLALVFRYADEKGLALLDLSDLRALLTFLDSEEGKADLKGIGGLSSATVGVLLRSLVKLEDGGGEELFGEPMFEIADLVRTAPDGRGVVSILELAALQSRPALFSTTLMWMVGELFESLPEIGDPEKPVLAFFLDEAHLLFTGATDAFIQAVTQTVRLIRSKGVGIYFITQSPTDVHEDVLAQLGSRIQHALRAFTPNDKKALKATADTYPTSDFYDVEQLLTSTGTGEAAVTLLSEKGVPTPVVHTRMLPPRSLLGPGPDIDAAAKASPLWSKYGTRVDNRSAREILAERVGGGEVAAAPAAEGDSAAAPAPEPAAAPPQSAEPKPKPRRKPKAPKEPKQTAKQDSATWDIAEDVISTLAPRGKKTTARSVTRLLRGVLGNRSR
jgi:uncharacterized protein